MILIIFAAYYLGIMKNSKTLENNEKLLIDVFKLQNEEAYDEALEKLEVIGSNLMTLIEGETKNSEFYMRVMPILKQERQLISEKDYKDFIHKNEKVLSKNFQKNAYLALLMQEMQHKTESTENKKWTQQEQDILIRMVNSDCSFSQIQEKFSDFDPRQIRRKHHKLSKKRSSKKLTFLEQDPHEQASPMQ